MPDLGWDRYAADAETAETGQALEDLRDNLAWFAGQWPEHAGPAAETIARVSVVLAAGALHPDELDTPAAGLCPDGIPGCPIRHARTLPAAPAHWSPLDTPAVYLPIVAITILAALALLALALAGVRP